MKKNKLKRRGRINEGDRRGKINGGEEEKKNIRRERGGK